MDSVVVRDYPVETPVELNEPDQASPQRPQARTGRQDAASGLVYEVLSLCASTFDTGRARFIRQMPDREWQVYSIQHETLIMHRADYAEVAMAWAVGLSRFPIRVTRPRITHPDGSNTRPIAVSSYVGIPVLCRDHLVGVIELAGNITADLGRTLDRLSETLQLFASRLTHDPSLHARRPIDLDVECSIDGGCWPAASIELSEEEWALLAAIREPAPLHKMAEDLPMSGERVIELVSSLADRGVVSVRAPSPPVVDSQAPDIMHTDIADSGGD